jgi:hypothetical protein
VTQVFLVFLNPSRQFLGRHLKLGHDHFFHAFSSLLFTVTQSFEIIQSELLIASLNTLPTNTWQVNKFCSEAACTVGRKCAGIHISLQTHRIILEAAECRLVCYN